MKHKIVKNLTEAHSWLGMIISVALFIVFWAGSISLFKHEINLWSIAPHYKLDNSTSDLPLSELITQKLKAHPFNPEEHLTIARPNEHHPWYNFYIDLMPDENGVEEHINIMVDPKTGDTIGEIEEFRLAQFIYQLHYDLHLPGGLYLVGIVTLLFFFAVISGVIIHAKKLFKHFFRYRTQSKRRDQLLDLHNLFGVISLPYTLMYALSGLVFNLAIIYQISFALFVYQGDQNRLLTDAGYTIIDEKPSGGHTDMTKIDQLVRKVEQQYNNPVEYITFFNYGRENAIVRLLGQQHPHFAQQFELYYRLDSSEPISIADTEHQNVLRKGVNTLAVLHFGNFAGIDLRILYFILGLGICAMIVTGNLLWIDKRKKMPDVSARVTGFVSYLTLGGCCGVVVATAVAFLTERILPIDLSGRGDWMENSFFITLLVVTLAGFGASNARRFVRYCLYVTMALLLLILSADWWY